MARSPYKVFFCALTLSLCVSCSYFSGGSNSNRGRGGANANANTGDTGAAIAITVGKAEARTVASSITATGTLVAAETSDVAPKVAGKVANIYVNVGQFVAGGTTIAKIDDTDARLRLNVARTSVTQANVAVRQAEARIGLLEGGQFQSSSVPEVRTAAANYQVALDTQKQAEANERRYRDLTQTGDVAMATYETYRTARDTSRAQANAAKETLNAAINTAKQNNQAIAAARAGVEAAQNQVKQAQQDLADLVVYAPFAGYVSARPVAVGEYVSTATSVITLLRTNPIKAEIQISEADVPYAAIGRAVAVRVDAYKDRTFGGTVSAVNPAIDPNSRSATVEALIENGDNALRTGMFANASITREGGAPGVFVPKSAVAADPTTNNHKVFVIQDGVAHLKVVQLGPEEGDFQQIISGVNGDETVATSGVDQLFEGAKVTF
ncbi:MAG: efflux RND transporter periplasmic adaptor subunit [Pyrinomonadaceae bacterium]